MIATDFEKFGKVSFLFEYASLIFVQKNTTIIMVQDSTNWNCSLCGLIGAQGMVRTLDKQIIIILLIANFSAFPIPSQVWLSFENADRV